MDGAVVISDPDPTTNPPDPAGPSLHRIPGGRAARRGPVGGDQLSQSLLGHLRFVDSEIGDGDRGKIPTVGFGGPLPSTELK